MVEIEISPVNNSYDFGRHGRVRVCKDCEKLLKADCFYEKEPGRLDTYCKSCQSVRGREYYVKNHAKISLKTKEYYDRKKADGSYYVDNRRRLLEGYGLTFESYDKLLCQQNGRCAGCGSSNPYGNGKNFHIDHDHKTNKVRGLLCSRCNTALGLVKEQIHVLQSLICYLQKEIE